MRGLLTLAIVALLAHAAYRVGAEYVTLFRFRDAVGQAARFRAKDDADLLRRIEQAAADLDLPVDISQVVIDRTGERVRVDGVYERPVELLPGREWPWTFTWSVDVTPPVLVRPVPQP